MQAEHLGGKVPRVPLLVQTPGLQHTPHSLRRRRQPVVRHVGEHVMSHVTVRDVVGDVVYSVPKLAVDRLKPPQDVLPLLLGVRFSVMVVVLQVRHCEEPPAETQVGRQVLHGPVGGAVTRREGQCQEPCARCRGHGALGTHVLWSLVEEPGLGVEVGAVCGAPFGLEQEVTREPQEDSPRVVQRQEPDDGVGGLVPLGRHPGVAHVFGFVVVKAMVLLV
mmetsp:Transcript_3281/g.8140  ORF Transcript_3281/g.8140 Transcript_3281/m.8140 type:complete len:220 (-) Transcript_3281:731-1390(-)